MGMEIEIINEPIRFHLHGIGGIVEDEQYGKAGFRLMNEMWPLVKTGGIATTGINHWVYFPKGKMFTCVELCDPHPASIPGRLEPLEFELPRYLKHIHVGPYDQLPSKWKALMTELAGLGEVVRLPSLEIYGHYDDDPSKLETTVLIGLQPRGE